MLDIAMGYFGWLLYGLTNNEVADTALSSEVFALASICEVVTSRKLVKSVGSAAQMDALAMAKERRYERRMLNCNSSNDRSKRHTNDLINARNVKENVSKQPQQRPTLPTYISPTSHPRHRDRNPALTKNDDPTSHKVRMHTYHHRPPRDLSSTFTRKKGNLPEAFQPPNRPP